MRTILTILLAGPWIAASSPGIAADPTDKDKKDEGKAGKKEQEKAEGKGRRGGRGGWKKKEEKKPKGWAVIQVGSDLHVVKAESIPEIQKALDKENEKGAKAASAAKDKDGKPARKFSPKKIVLVKDGLGTEREAKAFAAKHKEQMLARQKAEKAERAKKAAEKEAEAKKVPDDEVEL